MHPDRRKLVNKAKCTVDKLGRHLDRRILLTVVALWENGIETKASCEGHEDRACQYPWVDIPAEYEQKIVDLLTSFYADDLPSRCRLNYSKFEGGGIRLLVEVNEGDSLQHRQAEMGRFTRFLQDQYDIL